MNKLLSASSIALLLSGCILSQQPRNTRYIGDYTDFEKADFKAETYVYRHPITRVIDYNKFLIAPVTVYDNPQKKIKPKNQPFYDDLAKELHVKLVKLVSKNYTVVTEPGPGVLMFEYAIVDIKPNVWVTDEEGNRVLVTDTKRKGSKFELDCRDSQSDEQIFAISTLYQGDEYKAYENIGRIPTIDAAFDEWSVFLSKLIERAKDSRAVAAAQDRAVVRPSTSTYVNDPDNPNIFYYRHPRLRVLNYKHFYLARPRIEGRPNLTLEQRQDLSLKLREEAAKIFTNTKQLVNHPGPEILTVRTRIDETRFNYTFTLECLDPQREELVFGMIQTFSHRDIFEIYGDWNKALKERFEEAKENTK